MLARARWLEAMEIDVISEVGLDGRGGLFIRPASRAFPYIYREAMEVGWDPTKGYLFGPPPREWSYADWFRQICAAALEQGTVLVLEPTTVWRDIPDNLRTEIELAAKGR